MLFTTACLASLVIASPLLERRRFGQENKIQELVNTFKELSSQDSGNLGGGSISTILAASAPCNVVDVAAKVLAAGASLNEARSILALEKNFNPFVTSQASICLDPLKPENPLLRGILPLVDPALPGAAAINAITAKRNADIEAGTVDGAKLAAGQSIAQQMVGLGFTAIQGISATASASPPTVATPAASVSVPAAPASTSDTASAPSSSTNGASSDLTSIQTTLSDIESKLKQIEASLSSGNAAAPPASVSATPAPPVASTPAPASTQSSSTSNNVQTFTGSKGGLAPPVTKDNSNRPFSVNGNTFQQIGAAVGRSCDIQHNLCANAANKGGAGFNVGDCDAQNGQCHAAIGTNEPATPPAAAPPASVSATPAPAASNTASSSSNNVQKFTGSMGGPPPAVTKDNSSRPFSVNGSTFLQIGAAIGRSCDIQHNACANAANKGGASFKVGDCDTQNGQCHAAN